VQLDASLFSSHSAVDAPGLLPFDFKQFMQAFLRQVSTKLFYVSAGQWTNEPDTARDFGTLADAQRCAAQENLQGVELVLVNQHPHWEAVWPLDRPGSLPPE